MYYLRTGGVNRLTPCGRHHNTHITTRTFCFALSFFFCALESLISITTTHKNNSCI